MAKRRRTSSAQIVRYTAPRAPAPIIRIAAPRAAPKKKRGRRRSSSGFGGFGSEIQMGIGGALYGYGVKAGWVQKFPDLPVVGRTGAAAIALAYLSRHGGGQYARNAALAAAAIAGYQLGSGGSIVGDGMAATSEGEDY